MLREASPSMFSSQELMAEKIMINASLEKEFSILSRFTCKAGSDACLVSYETYGRFCSFSIMAQQLFSKLFLRTQTMYSPHLPPRNQDLLSLSPVLFNGCQHNLFRFYYKVKLFYLTKMTNRPPHLLSLSE